MRNNKENAMSITKRSKPLKPVVFEKSIQRYARDFMIQKGFEAFKLEGSKRCLPDFFFGKDGVSVFMEFKRVGQKPTEAQTAYHEKLRGHKFLVFVISTKHELEAAYDYIANILDYSKRLLEHIEFKHAAEQKEEKNYEENLNT